MSPALCNVRCGEGSSQSGMMSRWKCLSQRLSPCPGNLAGLTLCTFPCSILKAMKLASSTCTLPQVRVPSALPAEPAAPRAFHQTRPLSPASCLLRAWPSPRTRCSWQRRPSSPRRNSCWTSLVSWPALVGDGCSGGSGGMGLLWVSGFSMPVGHCLPHGQRSDGEKGCVLIECCVPGTDPGTIHGQASWQPSHRGVHTHTHRHSLLRPSWPPKAPLTPAPL